MDYVIKENKKIISDIIGNLAYELPTPLIIFDNHKYVVWANESAYNILNHKDLKGTYYRELFLEGSAELIDKVFKQLIEEGKSRVQLHRELSIIIDRYKIVHIGGIFHKLYKNNKLFITFFFTKEYTQESKEFNLNKLIQIIEQSDYPLTLTDLKGNILYINPAFTRLTGYSKDEAIGKNMRILKSGKHDKEFYRELWDTIASGKTWRGRITNKKKDGTLYQEYNIIFPIFSADGEIINFAAFKRDVTETINLKKEILRLSAFPEEFIDPIVEINSDGVILYMNPAAKKVFDKNKDAELFNVYLKTIEKEESKKDSKRFFINEIERKGHIYEVRVSYFSEEGIARIFFYDVTKRKQYEKFLEERNQKLKEAFKVFLEMTKKDIASQKELDEFIKKLLKKTAVILDLDKIIILIFNEEKNALIPKFIYLKDEDRFTDGYISYEESLPLYFQAAKNKEVETFIISPKHNAEIRAELDKYIQEHGLNNQKIERSSIDIPIRSGNDLIGILSFESFNKDREWTVEEELFAKYVADLIALKMEQKTRIEIERRLIEAKKRADAASAAKSEFLSRMSHELRTPLNGILGFSQILEEGLLGELTEEQKEAIEDILRSGKHLLELVNDILDISRIESGKVALSMKPILLQSLITEVINLVQPIASKRNIKIINNANEKEKIYVIADYTRLRQILINIFSNAIKYNKDEGWVKIDFKKITDNKVKITIEDSGIGIHRDKIKKLFEPFERLGRESSNIEGTGIGLTVVKKLIELMNGKIEVESSLGIGSSFSLIFPITSDTENKKGKENKERNIVLKKTYQEEKKILYIEDNLSNTRVVERMLLARTNIKLIHAAQGRIGIELAIAQRPNLILLDINLPDINGHKVLKKLKKIPELKNIPVVAVSADVMENNIEKTKKSGFSDFLKKPLDMKKFLEIIDKYLT